MGGVVAKMFFKTGVEKMEQTKYSSINEIEVKCATGEMQSLSEFAVDYKLLMIVNISSRCGLATTNYK